MKNRKLLFWGALIGGGILIYYLVNRKSEPSPFISGVIVPRIPSGQSNWPQNI